MTPRYEENPGKHKEALSTSQETVINRTADIENDSISVVDKLDRSRRDVLDLTLRNPLLNFRVLKAKGLKVIDEVPQEVYRILVREERVMYFEAAAQDGEVGSIEDDLTVPEELFSLMSVPDDEDDSNQLAKRYTDNKLQTPYERTRLDLRLRNTYRHAHLSIEEQGVNILYLALGTLNWYESESSDIPRIAPLVLVPVELKQTSARARFTVRWTDEEIDANLSLETKLKADFGIELPELPDAEDLVVDDYFKGVTAAVSAQERWSVDISAIHLSFFSFNKLLIYKDLDPKIWPEDRQPADHPVIRSLYGCEGFGESPPKIAEEDHLDDHLKVADTHQVVDADSSQTLAVIDVKNGRNLVIQGPPGTGKSQTITNLLSEAIADDKKVLFVAEKMAALEVVKRRLDTNHIGDACLELHSHTANKRTVLDELKRTLELGKPRLNDPTEDHHLLEDRRRRLNEYAGAINSPIGESGYTPNELIGRLGQIGSPDSLTDWPNLTIEGSASWSRQAFVQRRETVRELRALIEGMGAPREHLFWKSGRTQYMPTDRGEVQAAVQAALKALRECKDRVKTLCACLELETDASDLDSGRVATLVRTARRVREAPPLREVNHRSPKWIARSVEAKKIIAEALELTDVRATHDSVLIPEAWECDVLGCRQAVFAYGNKWWRLLSGEYRMSRKRLRGLCRSDFPAGGTEQLALVDGILQVQRLRKSIKDSQRLLSDLFPGLKLGSEPDAYRRLGKTAEWLINLHAEIVAGTVDKGIHDMLDRNLNGAKLEIAADDCQASADILSSALGNVAVVLHWRADRFPEGSALGDGAFSDLESWLSSAHAHVDSLHEITRFNSVEKRVAQLGLGSVTEAAASWKGAAKRLVDLFDRASFSVWMEAVFRERRVLREFEGNTHEEVINGFRQLDKALLQHNKALVAQLHWARLPRQLGGGQVGVLRREFEKRRRHLALRKLMTQAGNAIQQIKPVFMMSPLSIAKFIPPGSVRFDLVIFDEASQVRPVEAIGAILRSQQAVVVGDSKQLPPTSFFDRMDDGEEDDEERSSTADLESILGMFCAQGAPERMLRWHYRSRHESLITVSNNEFYDNRLVVFPSPDKGREDVGLRFQYGPKMLYTRGSGGRFNVAEARSVARAVMKHARTSPNLTLGVAAFSITQARRIEDELEILRRRDDACEHFFANHPEEPFFVKNLENVQGDERDVILISIGYGKIEGGYMPMNFGPLNKDGGERRLNVLITRARQRCEIHSNFVADDLDMKRTSARGVASLKIFLKYAQTGILDVPRESGLEADSPFEEAVAAALKGRGHRVDYQVGSGGFFIDLAVVDPQRPGRYLLGIECDGANYHRARSARDRDRLRQQVLEGLGWTIHRIWSTDWYNNPQRELAKTEEAISRASLDEFKRDVPRRRAKPTRLPREEPESGSERVDNTATRYKMASPEVYLGTQELHNVANQRILGWILEVVSVESPIHFDEVAMRIANAAGLQRAGKRIRERVGRAVVSGALKSKLLYKGDFLWRPGHHENEVEIRRRDDVPPNLRKPAMIAPEEIAAALLRAVQASYGINADDAVAEASQLFGYRRTGSDIRSSFKRVLNRLIAKGFLQKRGGQLFYLHTSHR